MIQTHFKAIRTVPDGKKQVNVRILNATGTFGEVAQLRPERNCLGQNNPGRFLHRCASRHEHVALFLTSVREQWPTAEDCVVSEEVGSSLIVHLSGWSRDLSFKSSSSQTSRQQPFIMWDQNDWDGGYTCIHRIH